MSSERVANWVRSIPEDAIAIQFRPGSARYVDRDGAIFFAEPAFEVTDVLAFIIPFVQGIGKNVTVEDDDIFIVSSFPDGSIFCLLKAEHRPLRLDIYRWNDF